MKLMSFLYKRPVLNFFIVIFYYLLVVLPHEQVGKLCARYLDEPLGRDAYNALILGISFLLLGIYLWPLWMAIRRSDFLKKHLMLYLSVTIVCAVLCFKLLMVINIEVVHFVQYSVMAVLLFPLVLRYGETLFWIVLLGALDEAYQYFFLAPQRTNYYDFNDVIINLIGGAFGLIWVRAQEPDFVLPPRLSWWRSPVFYATVVLAVIMAVLFAAGWFHYIAPSEGGAAARWSLIRVPQKGFWTIVHPNVTFHVIQPLEGILLTTGLLWFYSGLRRQ